MAVSGRPQVAILRESIFQSCDRDRSSAGLPTLYLKDAPKTNPASQFGRQSAAGPPTRCRHRARQDPGAHKRAPLKTAEASHLSP